MAPHSSTLAWKTPWAEEPGRLQSMGSLRVEHDWAISLSRVGEGNGNPLQCSCLENPRDGGAWWAAVYGVAQSRTGLTQLSSSSNSPVCVRVCMHVCVYARVCVHVCTRGCMCTCAHTCVRACAHVCARACAHVCTSVWAHTRVHVRVCMCVCVCTCVCVHVCVCVHACMSPISSPPFHLLVDTLLLYLATVNNAAKNTELRVPLSVGAVGFFQIYIHTPRGGITGSCDSSVFHV